MLQEKSYVIHYDYHENYLIATVSGEKDSLEVSLLFWEEIFDECKNRNYTRLLVTENFKNDISAIDMYILGEKLADMVPKNVSVAFVDEQIQQLELNKFSETVAYNRGGKGKVFSDYLEAEKWLLEQLD
jgi:hypothetical protein